jgi:hypothetical protein
MSALYVYCAVRFAHTVSTRCELNVELYFGLIFIFIGLHTFIKTFHSNVPHLVALHTAVSVLAAY